jgi:hypothetical protein
VERPFRLVAAMAILVLVVAGCGGDAESSSSPGALQDVGVAAEPVFASTARDGVIVTVRAAAGRLETGTELKVRVEIQNVGEGPVTWQSGGCGLLEWFSVEGPPIPQPPAGEAWPDAAGLAKWSATSGGVAISWIGPLNPPEGVVIGCPSNLAYDDIAPGETIVADAEWQATTTEGVPVPPGSYRITYAFPFIDRIPADGLLEVPEPPAPRPIELALPILVGGAAFAGIPSTLAIDAATRDPRVAQWIDDKLPKERLNGAEIRLVDGRWRYTIFVAGERSTVVTVDPASGRVEEVRLAD